MIYNGIDLLELAPIKDMAGGKYKAHGTSYGLGEAGYDISIKQDITFCNRKGVQLVFTCTPPFEISEYKTGRFTLASAIEEFDMPPNLVGIVHDKSTWARKGLSVFNTVIEPNWKGFLTLELVYHGNEDLIIPAGSGIAQVIFHELKLPGYYAGKYQNQPDEPVTAKETI